MNRIKNQIKKVGLRSYIKSRILTPREIVYGFKHCREMFCDFSIGNALFCARYNAGPKKCIEGYDFT